MIDLAHLPRRKPDLVAVRAVTLRRTERDLLLGELARQRILDRCTRVIGARHAHRLIDVGTPRERVAYRAAKAGSRTAERLNLRRMVVGLVLEHEEPVLILPVHIHRDADAARIDLLRFVEIVELSLRTQRLHADDSDVHQCHIALLAVPIEQLAVIHVGLIGLKNRHGKEAVFDIHGVDCRGKRRVTAVIRPVGVDDTQLRDRRGTVLRIAEILLHKCEIFLAHRKTVLLVKAFELTARELIELRENLHVHRQHNARLKCRRRGKRGLAALHFIDQIGFDLLIDTIIELSDQYNHARRTHIGALPLRHELHALRRRSCRRVKLPRQRLDRKYARV